MGASVSHGQKTRIWISLGATIAILALAVAQLAQPPSSLKPKIFVIGLSKTGTTSVGDALERLGYRRLGWRDIRSRHLVHTWSQGDWSGVHDVARYYDALEDLPWAKVYREMAALFPTAKFVLSVRRDEKTWLRSMETHMGRGEWMPYGHFYGATTFRGNEAVIRESYVNHSRQVREFFSDMPERYVELVIDDGEANWDVLCRVAQCPGGRVPSISFPKSNPASAWDMGVIPNAVRFCRGWTVTRVEEQLARYYYEHDVKAVKTVLEAGWKMYDVVERAYTELEFTVVALFSPPLTAEHDARV